MLTFTLERGEFEDGKGKCPYDPAKGHTGLLVGEWLSPLQARGGAQDLLVLWGHVAGVHLHLTSGLADPLSPTDGELYSATLNNFLGTEPVILRNMGPHHSMKTEYLAFWLNGEPRGAGRGPGGAEGGRHHRASLC